MLGVRSNLIFSRYNDMPADDRLTDIEKMLKYQLALRTCKSSITAHYVFLHHCIVLSGLYYDLLDYFDNFTDTIYDELKYNHHSKLEMFILKYIGTIACSDMLQKFHQNLNIYGVLCPNIVDESEPMPKSQKISFKEYTEQFKIKKQTNNNNNNNNNKTETTTNTVDNDDDADPYHLQFLTAHTDYDTEKIKKVVENLLKHKIYV
jgi:hypothetical protein